MNTVSLEKVVAPGLPPVVLHRTSLIASLADVIEYSNTQSGQRTYWHKLVLLCAPAGYGKTTLLADFERISQTRCCWVHIDTEDQDPIKFLQLVLTSIQHVFTHVGADLDAQLELIETRHASNLDCKAHIKHFIDSVVEAITKDIHEHFALLLCNYQDVNGKAEINGILDRLLEKLPSQCTIVIESRSIPKINFAPLLVRRQLVGFGTEHLCFSADDICELTKLLHANVLSPEEANHIFHMYGGWITGILLGTYLGRVQPFSQTEKQLETRGFAASDERNRRYLFAYLVTEVFEREHDVYAFLRELSIFPQMDPDVCNSFLSSTNAKEQLEQIEQQGLFVTHMTIEEQIIYTCHPILREMLVDDLKTKDPAHYKSLHKRAASLFYASGDHNQAILHAFEGQDYDFGVSLILQSAQALLRKGYSEKLATWIDLLPTRLQDRYPLLLVVQARLLLIKYRPRDAYALTEKVLASVSILPEDTAQAARAEVLIIQSAVMFQSGNYVATIQLCEQALELLTPEERELRTQAYQRLGACYCLQGKSKTGIAYLQQALQLWGRDAEARQTALLHMYLANAYNNLGNYVLADHHRRGAIRGFELIDDNWGKIQSLIGLGATKRLQGMLAEAETVIQQALDLATSTSFLSGQAYALLNLGEIYQDQGEYAKALTKTEKGLEVAQRLHDTYLLNAIYCAMSLTYLYIGDDVSAMTLVNECTTNAEMDSYEGALVALTKNIIYYWQCLYSQAEQGLTALYTILATTELHTLSLRTSIYFAACLSSQGKTDQVKDVLTHIATLVQQVNCAHVAIVEIGRLPDLLRQAQSLPALAFLWRNTVHESLPPAPENLVLDTKLSGPIQKDIEEKISRPECEETEATCQVFAFGEPRVVIGGEPITRWRTARALELFFFLIDAGQPVHKEQIMTALWPETDEHIEQNMRTTVYHLRKVIGEQCIVHRAGTYLLDLKGAFGDDVAYDVHSFRTYAEQAREILADDPSEAMALYEKMICLYNGDYVQTLYSDWSTQRRSELRDHYIEAHRQMALYAWQQGQFKESSEHWKQIVTIDDCSEEAHVGLIRCYLKQGKRGQALRQYQRCVAVLEEELGIEPGPALKKLYQTLTLSPQ